MGKRNRFRRNTAYIDQPNSSKDNIAEILGIIVLVLFVDAFLYLLITGILYIFF